MKEYFRNVVLGIVVVIALGMLLGAVRGANAHDHDHPELNEWYATLMQPDNPTVSCCGTADAYWCDDWYVRGGKTYCKITDDRDDAPLGRIHHVDIGTEILIPDYKLKFDRGNPTGHSVVFLSIGDHVYCFVQSSGI